MLWLILPLADLLLFPDQELASVKRENKDLKAKVLKMGSEATNSAEEMARMKVSAEEDRKKFEAQLAIFREELADTQKFNNELDLGLTAKS